MVAQEILLQLKPWIIQTLTPITDADVESLTDYVMALLGNDMSLDKLRTMCEEQLSDFLHGATNQFVRDLISQTELAIKGELGATQDHVGQQKQFRSNFRDGNNENVGFSNHQYPLGGPGQFQPQNMPDFKAMQGWSGMSLPNPQLSGILIPPFNMNMGRQGFDRNDLGGRSKRRNRKGPSNMSQPGPDNDYTKKRLIVENLPDNKLDKDLISEYFGRFGTLKSVSIIFEKKLAELEFESHDQARAAWNSPEPIFNNRFIKLYWKKSTEEDGESIDLEAVKRIQAQRQKEFEEKEKKRQDHQKQVQELLAAKTKIMEEQESLIQAAQASGELEKDPELQAKLNSTTAALKRQLAELQKEADSLGIASGGVPSYIPSRGGYRGGYRGRASYNPYSRGRGRGRGRGGAFVPTSRTNLDLRPKSVKFEITPEKDESVREFLSTVGGSYEDISRDGNDVIVNFTDRKSAERFFYSSKESTDLNNVKLEWTSVISTPPTPANQGEDAEMN